MYKLDDEIGKQTALREWKITFWVGGRIWKNILSVYGHEVWWKLYNTTIEFVISMQPNDLLH